jgi:hypothetical protein
MVSDSEFVLSKTADVHLLHHADATLIAMRGVINNFSLYGCSLYRKYFVYHDEIRISYYVPISCTMKKNHKFQFETHVR